MRRALRIVLWILAGIFFLLLIVIIGINTRPGKDFVKERAVAFLRDKLKTEVHIGDLDYDLPKMIVLKNVLVKDQAKDTLLSARELKVDIAMLKLINSNVSIQQVYLNGVYANIYRRQNDTAFNFDYIIKAFVSQGTDTSGAVTDTSATLTMNLDKLVVRNVRFKFNDYAGGVRMAYDIGDLTLTMKELDPTKMIFRAGKLYANNFKAQIIQGKSFLPEPVDTATTPLVLQIGAEEINLNNVHYNQQSLENQFFMDFKVGKLLVHPENIDIPNQSIAIKDFLLNNTNVNVRMGGRSAELAQEVADTLIDHDVAPPAKWRVTAGDLNINNVGFILDDETQKRLPSGIDFAHLNVQSLVLDANDINYTTDTIAGVINQLAAKEQSGLDIRKFATRFEYNPQGGHLRNLYLQTSNTILQDFVSVKYPSLDAIAQNPNLVQMNVHLKNSIIGMKDLLIFAPQLAAQPFFRKHRNGMVKLEADVEGRLDNLEIQRLYASGLGSTEIDMSGALQGMPNPNKISYNLKIAKLQSSKNDIETLLPPATLKQIRLPDRFGATGTISGNTLAYKPNLIIITTDGNASVNGLVDMSRGTGKERYNLAVKTQRLNIGKIIRNPQIGSVTADLNARGTSFEINSMNTTARGTIHAAMFNKYTYRNISFNGNVAGKKAKFNLVSNDPNAHLQLDGSANFAGKYPAIYADAMIDSIDLEALNFYASEMRFHGKVHADIAELNPDYPRALVTITNPIMTTNGRRYFLDSIYIVSTPSADSGNNIVINAQTFKANIWGRTPLTKIGDIVQHHINKHYTLNDSVYLSRANNSVPKNIPATYDLNLIAKIEDNPILQGLVPDLKDLDTIDIEAGLSPERIYLNADAPRINYMNYNISDAKVRVNGSDSALTYLASVDRVYQKSIDIWYANVSGRLSTNALTSNISIADPDSNQRFFLSGLLQRNGEEQVLQLNPNLVLNYKPWNVRQPNKIVFAPQGFYVQNFGINNGSESIAVNSETAVYNAPLRADIANFLLSNFTQIISKDTLLANGVLAGNINVARFNPSPQLTAQLGISNLSLLGDTVGDVAINVKNATENAIDANVGITGFGNNVSLSGLYYPTAVNGNNFNMTLGLNPLNVAAFEGAAQHQIQNTSGFLRGDLRVTGTMDAPSLNGQIRTDELRTTITMLGAPFYFQAEPINFSGQNIVLDDFDIRDSAGNVATINGRMNFKEMNLAMRLRANKWQAMSSTSQQNKDFYGRLFLSTNMNINGPVAAPNIDGSLNILKGTSVNVTIPTPEKGMQEREGIVEFVDMSYPENKNILMPRQSQDSVRKIGKVPVGSNINLNVTTDEEAEFSVVVDEGTGDFVRIKGVANLNTSVMPDGTLGLTGTYEIRDGYYQFSYNFIRREFRVQPGSTIVFSGDPTQAELNVTAYYEANVPPYDLVSRQVQDPAELVYFKQRLPFEVQMKISGPMMQPILAFDIVLPEEKNFRVAGTVSDLVQAKLNDLRNQPSELNKQVFALIILNRFVAEDPFQNGAGGGGAEALARQSVSRFVSEQLNKFAGGLIAGLDLTLDLQTSEDYTSGERRNRTDLNVGASKRLLNDRLTVNVGNNFQLEGPRSNSAQGTSYIPGNIAIDYDLSPDRRYRMRFFRRDEQTGELDGNVISTGASFILQVDYNRFRQVLMSRKKRLQMMEERRKQRQQERQQQNNDDRVKAASLINRKEHNDTN
ncbi:MAG TPA: translocation/assembly module TamB domain-containing protein [Flavipsychrobacter sp.]|nr:translocation/assembly module TamB domain-containing protein [Flavipsychrobacter sp.]